MIQLLCACRVGEVAVLQKSSILFDSNEILIDKGMIWSRKDKKFVELSGTKTGEEKRSMLTEELFEVVSRRIASMGPECEFIFHHKGGPLTYRQIQYRYNKALKSAGLSGRFSATHFARHTMVTFVRKETGSLDDTMAITGHECRKVASGYADYSNERGFKAVEAISSQILDDESVPECAVTQ